jgi:acetyl-CoA carboxylase biotin carboxyl carrier protein
MIDIRKLKELVKLMVENDLSELDLRDDQETVSLKRPTAGGFMPAQPQVSVTPTGNAQAAPTQAPAGDAGGGDSDDGLVPIVSPMVGTFYTAADPESPPFVAPGASVSDDTVVCIVEAMKVFSEIKAEVSGTIEKVLVKNAEAVEFGQELFLVRPS